MIPRYSMERVREGLRPEARAERLVLEEWELAPSEESVALAVVDGRSQAFAFAELLPVSSRKEVLALSQRGGGVVEFARTLLASVSPGGSYEFDLLPAGARVDAATNPAIAGFCKCGRTLAQGGGRQHRYCCRHCPLGTHSGGCTRREVVRVRS